MGKVLCFRRRDALSPNEAINGSPISATKFFERFLCRWRFALCLQHYAPMRSGKRRRAVMSISANRAQRRQVVFSGGHFAIELKTPAEIKPVSRLRQTLRQFQDAYYMIITEIGHSQSSDRTLFRRRRTLNPKWPQTASQ